MSSFNQRWQTLLQAARTAPAPEPPLPPPPVHRVREWLSAARAAPRAAGEGGSNLWFRYGVRGLATATAILLATVWFAFGTTGREPAASPLHPGIEHAVEEVFWLL